MIDTIKEILTKFSEIDSYLIISIFLKINTKIYVLPSLIAERQKIM